MRFAAKSVRTDTSICHEAVKRNFAAIEYLPSELRHNGTFLSLWLREAQMKLDNKPESRFETDFNKALRVGAQPRKGAPRRVVLDS